MWRGINSKSPISLKQTNGPNPCVSILTQHLIAAYPIVSADAKFIMSQPGRSTCMHPVVTYACASSSYPVDYRLPLFASVGEARQDVGGRGRFTRSRNVGMVSLALG